MRKKETTADGAGTYESGVMLIRPAHGWNPLALHELWAYRELLYFLIWRDIKVRYAQAALGVAWAVIQPIVAMVIFSVIFGRLAGLPSGGIPYPLFTMAALLPWQLFAGGLTRASVSLVGDANLVTKVYFPRLIIPLSAVVGGLADFAISFVVFIGLMWYYQLDLTVTLVWLPLLTLLTLLTTLAVGLWFSALNVQYRDVQHMIPFLVQAWMYASPVAYSINLIPAGPARWLYALNPMVGVIQGFRWALLGDSPPDGTLLVSVAVTSVLLISGLFYFRRLEDTFADVV